MKRIVQIAGIVLALVLIVVIVLPFVVDANRFKPALETELTKALGRQVKVGELKLSVFSGAVTAGDLSIADDPAYGQNAFLTAKALGIGVDLMPLIFSHRFSARNITIEQPEIEMLQSPAGIWNFSTLGTQRASAPAGAGPAAGGGLDLSVKLLKVSDGRITIRKTAGSNQPLVIDKVNAELHDFSAASAMPFSLSLNLPGGGQVQVDGTAGPIHAGDVMLTPAQVTLKASRVDLGVLGEAAGVTGMGGLVTMQGKAVSNGQTADVSGQIKAEKLRLVKGGSPATKTVEFDFELNHDLMARMGALKQGDILIGSAKASLTGTYTQQSGAMVLNATLAGSNMAVPELEGLLPALNVVLPSGSSLKGGTANAKLLIAGPASQLTATGSLGVYKTTLAGFDLGSRLSAIEKLAGMKGGPNTEIDTLSTNVKASQAGGEQLTNISVQVPSIADLSGAGTISPANALDFHLNARVHGGGVLTLASRTSIPVVVKGSASNPVFEPDVKAAATQEIKGISGEATKAAGGLTGLFGQKKKK